MNIPNIKSLLFTLWILMPFGLSGAPGDPKNVFNYAAEGDLSRVARALTETGTQYIYDSDGRSLLHHAAFGADPGFISLMINTGLDINGIDRDGLRPIHYAILGSNIQAIEFLVHRGALLNEVENVTCSPLFYAIVRGNRDVIEALLRLGANPMLECNRGMSPMHLSAYLGNLYFFQRFLDLYGMQLIEIPTRSGNTPLHCAAARGNDIIATFLLAYGVFPSPLNNDHQTPLRLAFNEGFKNIVLSLLRAESIRGNLPDGMTAIFRFLERGRQDADLVFIANALNQPNAGERDIHGLSLQDYIHFFEIDLTATPVLDETWGTPSTDNMPSEDIDEWIESLLNTDEEHEENMHTDTSEDLSDTFTEGSSPEPLVCSQTLAMGSDKRQDCFQQHRAFSVRRWHSNAYDTLHRQYSPRTFHASRD